MSRAASPTEKDVDTMPTQKIFKRRIRARMTKTGESYTAARHQLLQKTTDSSRPEAAVPPVGAASSEQPAPPSPRATPEAIPDGVLQVSDEAMERATGRRHADWFAILDGWGATAHSHTEIARWLSETHGVPPWWVQGVTVAYERARGMRATHQMRDGFSVSVTRTLAVGADDALGAFTSEQTRGRWLPDATMRRRPTRAAATARFDWADPPSRVVVVALAKADGKSTVNVTHEQIPDAASAARLKAMWRERLGQLRIMLEGG